MSAPSLNRLLDPLRRRVRGMVRRAIVRLVNDTLAAQTLQVTLLAGELADGAEHVLPYGFNSVPVAGAQAVVLAVGGHAEHLVAWVTDRRHRPTGGAPGEVTLYSAHGQRIVLEATGNILLVPKAGGHVAVNSDLIVGGDVSATGDVSAVNVTAEAEVTDVIGTMNAMRAVYNSHTHVENNGGGGNPATNPPLPAM